MDAGRAALPQTPSSSSPALVEGWRPAAIGPQPDPGRAQGSDGWRGWRVLQECGRREIWGRGPCRAAVLRFGLISLSNDAGCQPPAWSRPAAWGRRALPADSAFRVLSGRLMAPRAGERSRDEKASETDTSSHFTPTTRAREEEAAEAPWTCQPREQSQLGTPLPSQSRPPGHGKGPMIPSSFTRPKESLFFWKVPCPRTHRGSTWEQAGGRLSTIRSHSSLFSPCPCGLRVRAELSVRESLECPAWHLSSSQESPLRETGVLSSPAMNKETDSSVSVDEGPTDSRGPRRPAVGRVGGGGGEAEPR